MAPTAVPIGLSFDVDLERPGESADLTYVSSRWFGLLRGLPRIERLLDESGIAATFFVTGVAAESSPEAIARLARQGHEIGHHGYGHLAPAATDPDRQRHEFEAGMAAIERAAGAPPRGYRAPGFAMSAETFALVVDAGLAYDSSLMGDDRPYRARVGDRSIIEVPVHWALDDFPYVGTTVGLLRPGSPAAMFETWWAEVESAIADERPTAFCLHPDVIGRAASFAHFAGFVERLRTDPRVRFERHLEIAEEFAATSRADGGALA